MIVTRFSPGPWTFCAGTSCGPCGNIYGAHNRWLGQAFGVAHARDLGVNPALLAGPGEQMANMRLFAAGPGMFRALSAASNALRSYQHGNSATDLAKSIADACDVALAQAAGSAG